MQRIWSKSSFVFCFFASFGPTKNSSLQHQCCRVLIKSTSWLISLFSSDTAIHLPPMWLFSLEWFLPPPPFPVFFVCGGCFWEREKKKTDPAKMMCYCDNFPTVCELDMDLYFRQPWGETSIRRQRQCEAAAGVQLHVVNLWGWLQARVLLSC